MNLEVKNGRVLRRQSGSSLGPTVYTASPQAVKVVVSPHDKRVLIFITVR